MAGFGPGRRDVYGYRARSAKLPVGEDQPGVDHELVVVSGAVGVEDAGAGEEDEGARTLTAAEQPLHRETGIGVDVLPEDAKRQRPSVGVPHLNGIAGLQRSETPEHRRTAGRIEMPKD